MGCSLSPWQAPAALQLASSPPVHEKVAMICMPFQGSGISSLSVALLSTLLRQFGVTTEECYFHFDFAKIMGREHYQAEVDSGKYGQLGEVLFAEEVHRTAAGDEVQEGLREHFGDPEQRRRRLETFRQRCLERIASIDASLVGFSASCHQLLPSLWLAREIKKRWPRVRIVFGGSSCSDPMGRKAWEAYPEAVDYVVSGYGERPLLDLAFGRVVDERQVIVNKQGVDLETLPLPDYGQFLAQAADFIDKPTDMMLAFETSRGCWWGEKSHCAFCGLNQLEMAYAMKSSERALEEIRTLWERWGIHLFATDTILAQSHLKELMPKLAAYDSRPNIFYEVKANMSASEVESLKRANVYWIQPGIESLSSPLLKLIRKGITSIQNVAFLKWCREQMITVSWNLLCGIPGEELADYEEQIRLMARIPHLEPPSGISPIRVDRYSPYFNSFAEFGWSSLRPLPEYKFLHPQLDDDELSEIAYFFEGVGNSLRVDEYFQRMMSALDRWKQLHKTGHGLFWDDVNGLYRLEDNEATVFERSEILEAVLDVTHEVTAFRRLLAIPGVDEAYLEQLVECDILYREGQKVVNLAVRIPKELMAGQDELPEAAAA